MSGQHFRRALAESLVAPLTDSLDYGTSSRGMRPWVLVVACVGGVLALLALFVLLKMRRQRRRKKEEEQDGDILLVESRDESGEIQDTPRSGAYDGYTLDSTRASESLVSPWTTSQDFVTARIPMDSIALLRRTAHDAFSEDWLASYQQQRVTVKRVHRERRDGQQIRGFISEIRLVASLQHACILGFKGVAWASPLDPYMVVEYTTKDVRDRIVEYKASHRANGFNTEKLRIAFHVASALAYLHGLAPALIHRDLKSRSIRLKENGDAKVSGFDLARRSADATMTAGIGSARWAAPEIMLGEPYDASADVYSLGVVLCELDTHELPYAHDEQRSVVVLLQLVAAGQLCPQFTRDADAEMVALARECLEMEPQMRPTAADVMYRLGTLLEQSTVAAVDVRQ